MEDRLTVTRLSVRRRLKRTFASTKRCESMIETVRRIACNVEHWSSDMCLRCTAAGMLEAETQLRRIIGHANLTKLTVAVDATRRPVPRRQPTTTAHLTLTTAAPELAASPA
jgi:hypothetical protein